MISLRSFALSVFFGLMIFSAGCDVPGSKEPPPKTEIKVAFWGSHQEIDIITSALKPWQAENPGISVRFEHTPYTGYDSKILTRIVGGAAPDVIAAEADYFVTFATRDVYLDLTPLIQTDPEFSTAEFFPKIMDRFTVNSKVLSIPRDVAPFACVFYNMDLFDREGVAYPTDDWTWNDLLAKAKALTKVDKSGRVTQYGFYGWAWQNFVYGNGGVLVNNPKHPTRSRFSHPRTIEGLQFFSDLINVHKVMPTPMALANAGMGIDLMFASGRIAMFLSGIWETPALRQKHSFRWDVAMFPQNPRGIRKFGSGGTGYGILKNTKHPEAAWEIVKALTSESVQAELAGRGLAQPSRIKVAQGEHWAESPLPPANKKMLNEAVNYIMFDPFYRGWREIQSKWIDPKLDLLKAGKITAKEMADELDAQITQQLQAN